jgi:phenylalanyl-tRNA synthetase beta chain
MLTSVTWLNDYLDPPASAEEQAELLTRAGFPLEDTETVQTSAGEDTRQDFEMTSNRGDAVCHLGLAREICAISGRTLKKPVPSIHPTGPHASSLFTITNEQPELCPLYTGRIIRGVKIGPSPAWLADRLIARGDIPRNNVVDATNFVLFEMGQPTHVFDLNQLKGGAINVRMAHKDEPFLPIGEGEAEVKLSESDLVIADGERAVAIAGVKGGALTAVTNATTDLLLEAASFNPVAVRNTSRRLGIASDSSYRFERGVHPGQVNEAAERLAELILELAGGELCEGVLEAGAPIPERRSATMRTDRCRQVIGVDIPDEQMMKALSTLGFEPILAGKTITCIVPHNRLDIEREIDLIEEVSRMFGHDNIPIHDTIEVKVVAPQPTELAKSAVADTLVGMGFIETTTHSLVGKDADTFLPPGAHGLMVDDDRAKSEPMLRPAVLPSLLRVRAHNQDNGVTPLNLFESAATFWSTDEGHQEVVRLGLLMDAVDPQAGLRPMRGAIQRLADLLLGHEVVVDVKPDDSRAWLAPGAAASINGAPIGVFGMLAPDQQKKAGLDTPVMVAELELSGFYEQYPPETEAHALPSFPAIERDISAIVDERTAWADIEQAISALKLDWLEDCGFVTTYRGKGVDTGAKSLTLRLTFRAADRTLTHDEVDGQVDRAMKTLSADLGAEIRS